MRKTTIILICFIGFIGLCSILNQCKPTETTKYVNDTTVAIIPSDTFLIKKDSSNGK